MIFNIFKFKKLNSFIVLLILSILMVSCKSKEAVYIDEGIPKDLDVNFKLVIRDIGIDNPQNDQRSYYKVYIDKVYSGRTTIGLESQKKFFEAKLSPNTHLIIIEKWVLDKATGEYKKLNNIRQPSPNYYYIETDLNNLTELNVIYNKKDRKAVFQVIK